MALLHMKRPRSSSASPPLLSGHISSGDSHRASIMLLKLPRSASYRALRRRSCVAISATGTTRPLSRSRRFGLETGLNGLPAELHPPEGKEQRNNVIPGRRLGIKRNKPRVANIGANIGNFRLGRRKNRPNVLLSRRRRCVS